MLKTFMKKFTLQVQCKPGGTKYPFRKTTNKSSITVPLCKRRLDLPGGTSQSLTTSGIKMEKYTIRYNVTLRRRKIVHSKPYCDLEQ